MKNFYTTKEVAELLRVSERSVYRYIENDKLKASKIGHWRITPKDLDTFLGQHSNLKSKKK